MPWGPPASVWARVWTVESKRQTLFLGCCALLKGLAFQKEGTQMENDLKYLTVKCHMVGRIFLILDRNLK